MRYRCYIAVENVWSCTQTKEGKENIWEINVQLKFEQHQNWSLSNARSFNPTTKQPTVAGTQQSCRHFWAQFFITLDRIFWHVVFSGILNCAVVLQPQICSVIHSYSNENCHYSLSQIKCYYLWRASRTRCVRPIMHLVRNGSHAPCAWGISCTQNNNKYYHIL